MSIDESRLLRFRARRHDGGLVECVSEYKDGSFGGSLGISMSSARSLAEPLSVTGVGYKAYETREQAAHEAGEQLKATGHVCDERCDERWTTRWSPRQ
jgi:hypothetical protein